VKATLFVCVPVLAIALATATISTSRRELQLLPGVSNGGRVAQLAAKPDGTWSLLLLADVQGGAAYLPGIVKAAAASGVSALVIAGDLSRGSGHLQLATRELRSAAPFPVPLFAVPGNHDVKTGDDRELFERCFGSREFAFRIGDTLVMGLDATRPEEELASLRQQLARARAEHLRVVIVRHFPVWKGAPGTPNRRFLEAIRGHDVAMVLSGHGHAPSVDEVGGVQFVVAPASGDRSEGQGQTPVSYLIVRWTGTAFRIERHDRLRINRLDLRSAVDHLVLVHALSLTSRSALERLRSGRVS
jgi:predicted phosphodiesterase